MRISVAKLTDEELVRWRAWCAKDDAMSRSPSYYSREEQERHSHDEFRLSKEIADKYMMETWRAWKIDPRSGDIWYEED